LVLPSEVVFIPKSFRSDKTFFAPFCTNVALTQIKFGRGDNSTNSYKWQVRNYKRHFSDRLLVTYVERPKASF
jgi:hypothetical protein